MTSVAAFRSKEEADQYDESSRKHVAAELRKLADAIDNGDCTGVAFVALGMRCEEKACEQDHTTMLSWVKGGEENLVLRLTGALDNLKWGLHRGLVTMHAMLRVRNNALMAQAAQSDKH